MKKIYIVEKKGPFIVFEEFERLFIHEFNWAPQGGVMEYPIDSDALNSIKRDFEMGNDPVSWRKLSRAGAIRLHAKYEMPFDKLKCGDLWDLKKQAEYYLDISSSNIQKMISRGKATTNQEQFLKAYTELKKINDLKEIIKMFECIGNE